MTVWCGIALCTAVLWHLPLGAYVLYPFTILAVWFHEMGHGLAALALGAHFEKLVLYTDGSGAAYYQGAVHGGALGRAAVAAAGPLGPACLGGLIILSTTSARRTRAALLCLAVLMLLAVLIWVRSGFGVVSITALAVGILAIALKAPEGIRRVSAQFLGVQACISTYREIDYLFSLHARGLIGDQLSDTQVMAENLLMPYWFWGALLAAATLYILIRCLRASVRRPA